LESRISSRRAADTERSNRRNRFLSAPSGASVRGSIALVLDRPPVAELGKSMKQCTPLFFLLVSSAVCAAPSHAAVAGSDWRSNPGDMNISNANIAQRGVGEEKRTRSVAQQKIDSQLLYALYRERGEAEAKGVPAGELRVKFDEQGRAIVSIRARVTRKVLAKIKSLGGKVASSSERYNDITAHLRLGKLEELAALKDVRAIMPAEEAITNPAK